MLRRRLFPFFAAAIFLFSVCQPAFAADNTDLSGDATIQGGGRYSYHSSNLYDFISAFSADRGESIGGGRFDSQQVYNDYVSSLDSSTANAGTVVTDFSYPKLSRPSSDSVCGFMSTVIYQFPNEMKSLFSSLGINHKVAIYSQNSSNKSLYGFYFDSIGQLKIGIFESPLGQCHASLYGVYDLSDLTLLSSNGSVLPRYNTGSNTSWYNTSSMPVFYSKEWAESWSGYLTSECYAFDFDGDVRCTLDTRSNCLGGFSAFYKEASSSTWNSVKRYM